MLFIANKNPFRNWNTDGNYKYATAKQALLNNHAEKGELLQFNVSGAVMQSRFTASDWTTDYPLAVYLLNPIHYPEYANDGSKQARRDWERRSP